MLVVRLADIKPIDEVEIRLRGQPIVPVDVSVVMAAPAYAGVQ